MADANLSGDRFRSPSVGVPVKPTLSWDRRFLRAWAANGVGHHHFGTETRLLTCTGHIHLSADAGCHGRPLDAAPSVGVVLR